MSDAGLWTLYRSFLAVMREGSLSRAAALLSLSQPTLGRHVEALEAALGGAPLFTRHPRGLTPTEAARALLPHVEAMDAAAAAARRAAVGQGALSGAVRIAASEVIGAEVLPGLLAPLREAHPGLSFELSLSSKSADLLRRDSDIAVRMTTPVQGALVAAKAGAVKLGLYAHRSYTERRAPPQSLETLWDHPVIGFDRADSFNARTAATMKLDRRMFALRVDNDLAALAALRAGFGLGVCQHPIAARDPDLTPVMAREISFRLDIWIVMHETLKRERRMAVVFEHLVRGMRAYARGHSRERA